MQRSSQRAIKRAKIYAKARREWSDKGEWGERGQEEEGSRGDGGREKRRIMAGNGETEEEERMQ